MSAFAALFDWDGVIIDSSRAHAESWDRLAAEEHRGLPEDHFRRGFGMKNEKIIPELLGWTHDPTEIRRLSLRKEEHYRTITRERGVLVLPGVRQLLTALRRAGIPCAIGSSTHRENIETALTGLGFHGCFQAVVAAEDVVHGKPAPDIFLLAARKLGAVPARCVVFEDAHAGIDAAHVAGMKVIACATTNPAEKLGNADRVVQSLAEVQLEQLTSWFTAESTSRRPRLQAPAQLK